MITASRCQNESWPENENPEWLRSITKASVIIPTYNRAGYLVEAIQSVLNQTFRDFELIIVDDGSTDNTREVVERFLDTRVRYIYQENSGVSSARNTGIKVSRGEYIAFLDSDDIWLSQNLEMKVKLLDSRPDIGMVCSDAYVFDDNTRVSLGKLWRDPVGEFTKFDPVKAVQQSFKELLHLGCFMGPPLTVIRRQVFTSVGYFDESLSNHEDWDLFIRVVQRFTIAIIDTPLVKLRRHSNNITENHEKMYLGAVVAAKKVIHSILPSGEELKLLNQRLLPKHIYYGRWALFNGKEAAARKALGAAIRIEPRNIKLYVSFIYSFLGTKKYLALRNWKKKLGLILGGASHREIHHLLSTKDI